jgi:hypothetical protein
MSEFDPVVLRDRPKPSTLTVLGLLAGAAATFSYLGAYAVANALVANDLLSAWPHDHDPRPRWFATGFFTLMLGFMGVAAAARFLSQRQLDSIDEISEGAESG